MNKFKFRIWHKGKMIHWKEIVDSDEFLQKIIEGNYDEFVLMQYIDLKDTNGKEIYEGDILKYEGKSNNHGIRGWEFQTSGVGVVRYYLGSYYITYLNDKNIMKTSISDLLTNSEETTLEKLGNIYDDKELLDKYV